MVRQRLWKLRVATWNVTSLKNKEFELVEEAGKYRLDIVGLSSTKRPGSGTEDINGWSLCYAGVSPFVHAQAGVGILISPRLVDNVVEWVPISSRVGVLRLNLPEGKALAIVTAYAPNAETEYAAFLDDLDSGFARIPPTESLMLLGDFNAHVGNDTTTWHNVIGMNGDAHLNANGEKLLDFCAGHALSIMNTFFQHKAVHKYTWYRDALAQRSLIDFIIVSSDLKRLVLDVRAKRGAELSTDHHLVVANIRCCAREPARRRGKAATRVRWEALREQDVRDDFARTMAEKFQAIPESVADVETEWGLFKNALLGAAADCCGLKRVGVAHGGTRRTPWWNQDVKNAVGEKKALFKLWIANKTPDTRARYEKARRAAAKAVAEAKDKAWELFGEEMEANYRTATKMFWQTVRRLRNQSGGTLRVLRDKQGCILRDEDAILKRWKEHFEELLNPTSANPPIPELHSRAMTSLDVDEVWRAIHRLKSGKAAGVDEIRPEMLKALGGEGFAWITRVFQVAWDSGEAPMDWQTGVVIPLFKKGDKTCCDNYRGITLLSLPGKVYAKVLESRLRAIVESKILDEQCGFRPGRSTTDQVFTLHQTSEKAWEYAKPVYMCFVDLEKAYDRVPRDQLWQCLAEYQVDAELLVAIQSLYKNCEACVRVNGIKSKSFTVGAGLRQGCVLSPLLFVIFMDRIVRRSRGRESVRIGNAVLGKLLFADDLALLTSSQADLQSALERFAAECEANGMRISTGKTEVMVLSRRHTECTLYVNGVQLRQVEEFKYLGVMFSSDGRQDKEIDRRINQASAVPRELGKMVVSNTRLSQEAKLAVFKTLYRPILTYGQESWILTERTRSRVQAAEMRFLRKIMGVTRLDRVRNTVIRETLGVEPLLLLVEKAQLRWYGHVLRMAPDRMARTIFTAVPDGRRPVGRPRTRWTDQVNELCKRMGLEPAQAQTQAEDRTEWRRLVSGLPPRPERIRRI